MTHRERVLAALNHRQPDQVPVDLSGHRSSGISAIAYPKLRAALGLEPRAVYVYDPVQQLAIVHDDVLDAVGADTIEMGRGFCLDEKWWADWTLPDGAPCKMPVWAEPGACGGGVGLSQPRRARDRANARGGAALRSDVLAVSGWGRGSVADRRVVRGAHVDGPRVAARAVGAGSGGIGGGCAGVAVQD